jgi:hypothetical protein
LSVGRVYGQLGKLIANQRNALILHGG